MFVEELQHFEDLQEWCKSRHKKHYLLHCSLQLKKTICNVVMGQVIADTVKLLNQGQINSHLTGGTADFPRRVHWCAVKELTKLTVKIQKVSHFRFCTLL